MYALFSITSLLSLSTGHFWSNTDSFALKNVNDSMTITFLDFHELIFSIVLKLYFWVKLSQYPMFKYVCVVLAVAVTSCNSSCSEWLKVRLRFAFFINATLSWNALWREPMYFISTDCLVYCYFNCCYFIL